MPMVMAYRGASADFPEHSLGAYREAINQGVHFIECDVVLTSDLVPVCRHEPNITDTTDVLAVRRRQPALSNASDTASTGDAPTAVLASDLTLAELEHLSAVFPASGGGDGGGAVAAAATASSEDADAADTDIRGAAAQRQQCSAAAPAEAAPEAGGSGPQGACSPPWAVGGAAERDAPAAPDDYRVATLEDLLRMASAAQPAVGVALHIQFAAWHNTLPQVRGANTSFEDILLGLMQRYGYATGPYGSDAWRARPSYIMAFEAGSLQYLAQRTSSPLTQVLGPTIPDTSEPWDSATSAEGLARIRGYAGSVAVARQQLLAPVLEVKGKGAGGDGGQEGGEQDASRGGGGGSGRRRLVATEPLLRMRQAGLQVFASVFKPRPASHLLYGVRSWEEEVAPLLGGMRPRQAGQGTDPTERPGAAEPDPAVQAAAAAAGREPGGEQREAQGAAVLDGLFTDSPAELLRLIARLRCRGVGAGGGDGTAPSGAAVT